MITDSQEDCPPTRGESRLYIALVVLALTITLLISIWFLSR
ncbi:MAG: hypothetical protein V4697_00030 [Patescibacteria group bacterium]